jgi:hypothetical protein
MPVLEMDAISREKALIKLAAALRSRLAAAPDGISRDALFAPVMTEERCYRDDLLLALSRLDVLEDDNGMLRLLE